MAKDDDDDRGDNVHEFKAKKERVAKQPVSYTVSPELERVANSLIAKKKLGLSHLGQASILFLYTTSETAGKEKAATAGRFPKRFTALEHFDFVICVSKPTFDRLAARDRDALMYHQLLHCGINEKGAWYIAKHDWEGFILEVKEFGPWTEGAKLVTQQLSLFDQAGTAQLAAK